MFQNSSLGPPGHPLGSLAPGRCDLGGIKFILRVTCRALRNTDPSSPEGTRRLFSLIPYSPRGRHDGPPPFLIGQQRCQSRGGGGASTARYKYLEGPAPSGRPATGGADGGTGIGIEIGTGTGIGTECAAGGGGRLGPTAPGNRLLRHLVSPPGCPRPSGSSRSDPRAARPSPTGITPPTSD